VVGLDTLVHVANGIYENCPNDEQHDLFKLPEFVNKMMENKWLGSKTGQGFIKKRRKRYSDFRFRYFRIPYC
jgi:3-hydroxyacyl-CoA dehydrogenase